MDSSQILPGAVDLGPCSLSTGYFLDKPFIVYALDRNVVIVDAKLRHVQTILGSDCGYGDINITSLHSAEYSGRVAVAWGCDVVIFEPKEKDEATSSLKLAFPTWCPSQTISLEYPVLSLCWDGEGMQLLTGGESIVLWSGESGGASFGVGGETTGPPAIKWVDSWRCKLSQPVMCLKFSSDGVMFASYGKNDPLVKIWYPARSRAASTSTLTTGFSFSYIAHPRAVTSFSWRKIGVLMPRHVVPNVLLTHCKDNICRLWSHKLLKKNKKQRLRFFISASIDPITDIPFRSLNAIEGGPFFVHWLNNKETAFTTKAEKSYKTTSAPLSRRSSISSIVSEEILQSWVCLEEDGTDHMNGPVPDKKPPQPTDSLGMTSPAMHVGSFFRSASSMGDTGQDPLSRKALGQLVDTWCNSPDLLLCIHPNSGSLMVWTVEGLDGSLYTTKLVHVSFSACLPHCFPLHLASSLCHELLQVVVKAPSDAQLLTRSSDFNLPVPELRLPNHVRKTDADQGYCGGGQESSLVLVSKHLHGTLNIWSVELTQQTNHGNSIAGLIHCGETGGHRFEVRAMLRHPRLPLLLTVSCGGGEKGLSPVGSELIVWSTELPGSLEHNGSISELAKMSSISSVSFRHTAWVPPVVSSRTSQSSTSQSSTPQSSTPQLYHTGYFVTNVGSELCLYEVSLFENVGSPNKAKLTPTLDMGSSNSSRLKGWSNGSGGGGGGGGKAAEGITYTGKKSISIVASIESDILSFEEVLTLHVFRFSSLVTSYNIQKSSCPDFVDSIAVVLVENRHSLSSVTGSQTKQTFLHVWMISFDPAPGSDPTPTSQPVGVKVKRMSPVLLPLAQGVHATSCVPATDIPSSFQLQVFGVSAPFLFSTACSDNTIRSWQFSVHQRTNADASASPDLLGKSGDVSLEVYEVVGLSKANVPQELCGALKCSEDSMLQSYALVSPVPCAISSAYPGQFAMAHHLSHPSKSSNSAILKSTSLNKHALVSIWECKSSGGLRWSCESTLQLTGLSTLVVESQNPKVMLEWVPIENGSYLLATCFSSIISIFSQSLIVEHDLLKVVQKSRTNENTRVPEASHVWKPSWVRILQFDCCQSYPSLYASALLYTGSNSLLVSIGNELHLYSCYAKGSDLEQMMAEGFSHPQSSRNKAQSPPPLLLGVDSSKVSRENTMNLLNYAQARNISLPQYHPTILMKLMSSGKVTTVKLILVNLSKYLTLYQHKSQPKDEAVDFQGFVPPEENTQGSQRQRLLSVSADGLVRRSNKVKVTVSVDSIPALSLSKLGLLSQGDHQGGKEEGQADGSGNDYDELFSTGIEPTLQDFSYGFEEVTKGLSFDDINPETSSFTPEMAQQMSAVLQYTQLPGLSDLEQVLLLTIAETVANTKMGIGVQEGATADAFRGEPSDEDGGGDGGILSITGAGYAASGRGREAMDDCGFRYLLILQNYVTLSQSLPKDVCPNALTPVEFIWAFHSEAEKELLAAIPGMQNDELTWDNLRNVGAGWWVRSSDTLRRLMEKLARNQFTQKKDPLNASLFYLAMKKKSLLKGLFKTIQDQKMTDFFNNDFSQDRWRKAALKNAFALLGKQRFDQAAAFFLLAGKLWDAVEVCINQLQDLQLTWVIIRLYEGDNGPTSERFLKENVIGISSDGKPISPEGGFDPFLRSIGYWLLQDYCSAQETLLQSPSGKFCLDPTIFNFYFFLRQHPLMLRRDYAGKGTKQLYQAPPSKPSAGHHHLSSVGTEPLTAAERGLLFNTAYYHLNNGCPLLCLDVLSRLPKTMGLSADEEVGTMSSSDVTSAAKRAVDDTMIQSGALSDLSFGRHASVSSKSNNDVDLDWSKPVSSAGDADMDWSTPLSLQVNTNLGSSIDDEDDWSKPVSSRLRMEDDLDLSNTISSHPSFDDALSPTDTITPVPSVEDLKLSADSKSKLAQLSSQGLFILSLAEQLQYSACLNILTDELATLHLPACYGHLWKRKGREGLPLLPLAKVSKEVGLALYQKDDPFEKILPVQRSVLLDWLRREIVVVKKLCGIEEEPSDSDRLNGTNNTYFWCELLSTHLNYIALHSPTSPNMQYIKFELMHLLNTVLPWNSLTSTEADSDVTSSPAVSNLVVDAVQLPILTSCALSTQHPTNLVSHLRLMCSSIVEVLSLHSEPPLSSNPLQGVATLFELSCAISCCLSSCLCPVKLSELLRDVTTSGLYDNSAEVLSSTPLVLSDNTGPGEGVQSAKQGPRPRSDDSVFVADKPNTKHAAWPGLQRWPNTLQSEEGKDPTPISLFLVECSTVAYMGLMAVAWSWHSVYDILVLLANAPSAKMWDGVFGGGLDLKKSSQADKNKRKSLTLPFIQNLDTVARHLRSLINTKAQDGPSVIDSGVFVPAKRSLLRQYLTKPKVDPSNPKVDFEYVEQKQQLDEWQQLQAESDDVCGDHDNPDCLSWTLMNVCITKQVTAAMKSVVAAAGVEILELVTASPVLYKLLKVLQSWESFLSHKLELSSAIAPEALFQSDNPEGLSSFQNGPAIMRQKRILDPDNSPFKVDCPTSNVCKQLWTYLAHQDESREFFLQHLISKKRLSSVVADSECDQRVVYKDTEGVISFCVNSSNPDILALATARSVEEISLLDGVDLPAVEENTESRPRMTKSFSIAGISDEINAMQMATVRASMQSPVQSLALQSTVSSVLHSVLVKRPIVGVRRMAAHPTLAYYLTGSSDGSVSMWEFGTANPVSVQKSPQGAGVVTKIRFTPQGNKYGVTDANGKLHLWQGIHASPKASYQTLSSGMRFFADFVFLSSSSFIAACGESSDMRNLCLWDTLLPTKRSIVREYVCHDGGASALGYSPRKNRIICGGKKGEICIFDVRQHALLQSLTVHSGAINSIVVNDADGYFITGSSEGDIKVLDLASDAELASFTAIHSKARMFRSEGGVRDMYVLPGGKLYSCGGDGCIKSRVVNT